MNAEEGGVTRIARRDANSRRGKKRDEDGASKMADASGK
jgi:hypothetical protein